jgi:hypothetical protein
MSVATKQSGSLFTVFEVAPFPRTGARLQSGCELCGHCSLLFALAAGASHKPDAVQPRPSSRSNHPEVRPWRTAQ